jgi:hypothetical protein
LALQPGTCVHGRRFSEACICASPSSGSAFEVSVSKHVQSKATEHPLVFPKCIQMQLFGKGKTISKSSRCKFDINPCKALFEM